MAKTRQRDDWLWVDGEGCWDTNMLITCFRELRARVEALEARRPLDIETTYGSEAAADAAQILHAPMVVEGTFDHGGKTYRYKANATPERDPAMPELCARVEALEQLHKAVVELNERFSLEPLEARVDALEAAQPAPEVGEVGELVVALRRLERRAMDEGSNNGDRLSEAVELDRIATLLSQPPAPAPAVVPVAVAERPWEKGGWTDLDGECWWCPPDGPAYWSMANPAMVYGGWLLPAHAIPLPQGGEVPHG
jgi:hypothetical protein